MKNYFRFFFLERVMKTSIQTVWLQPTNQISPTTVNTMKSKIGTTASKGKLWRCPAVSWYFLCALATLLCEAPAWAIIICGSTSTGTHWLVPGPPTESWGEQMNTGPNCDAEVHWHASRVIPGVTFNPTLLRISNSTLSGTFTWTTTNASPIVVRPGSVADVPLSGPPYAGNYTVAFSQGRPGRGETILLQALEVVPGTGNVPLAGFVLDVGGEIFGQPSQVGIIYVDASGLPVNVNKLRACVIPIDVDNLRGALTTAQGTLRPPISNVSFAGLQHSPLGDASLTLSNGQLVVGNLGSTNQAGVSVALGDSEGYCLLIGPVDPDGTAPSGASLELATVGRLKNQTNTSTLSTIVARKSGDTIMLDVTQTSERSNYLVEAYYEGSLVLSTTYNGVGGFGNSHRWPYFLESRLKKECRPFHNRILFPKSDLLPGGANRGDIWIGFGPIDVPGSGGTPITIGGKTVYANLLRLVRVGTGEDLEFISEANLTAARLPSLSISGEMLYAFGRQHAALDNATLSAEAGTLTISNIAGSGKMGVRANCCPAAGFGMDWNPINARATNAILEVTVAGSFNGEPDHSLGQLAITCQGDDKYSVLPKFGPLGSASQTIQVYNNGTLVIEIPDHSGMVAASAWPLGCAKPGPVRRFIGGLWRFPWCYRLTYPTATSFQIGGSSYVGNDLRVLAEDVIGHTDFITSFTVTTSNIAQLRLVSESIKPIEYFAGLPNAPVGAATLTVVSNKLEVSNIGSSGEDGVSVQVGELKGYSEVGVETGLLRAGTRLVSTDYGKLGTNQDVAVRMLTMDIIDGPTGRMTVLTPDFSPLGARTYNAGLLLNGETASCPVPGLSGSRITYPVQAAQIHWPGYKCRRGLVHRSGDLGCQTIAGYDPVELVQFLSPVPVQINGGAPIMADHIVIAPEGSVAEEAYVTRTLVQASGTPTFTVFHESLGAFRKFGSRALGGANIKAGVSNLTVSDLGFDGQGGIAVTVYDARGCNFRWVPIGDALEGAFLRSSSHGAFGGAPNALLDELVVTKSGTNYVISADFSPVGSPTQRVLVFNDGVLLAQFPGHTGTVGIASAWPIGLGKLGGRTPCRVIRWPKGHRFQINGTSYAADEVRVLAENLSGSLSYLTEFDLRATGLLSSLVVTQEDEQPTMRILAGAGSVKIWFEGDGFLQSADEVIGPWTEILGAVPLTPFIVRGIAAKKFYRVQTQW